MRAPHPSTPWQVIERKKFQDVDWKRHGLFCTFGLFYLVSLGTAIRAAAGHAVVHCAACMRLAVRWWGTGRCCAGWLDECSSCIPCSSNSRRAMMSLVEHD